LVSKDRRHLFLTPWTEPTGRNYVLTDGEEGSGSSLRLGLGSFYTMKFYQQFFDVDDRDVAIRLLYSMFPVPGK
jgi:hypothetical protein